MSKVQAVVATTGVPDSQEIPMQPASTDIWDKKYRLKTKQGEPLDADQDLYGGFVGNGDRRKLNELRALSPEALAQARVSFQDERLEELLFRYRARNFPHTLSDDEQARWQAHCVACLHEDGGARNLMGFFEKIDTLSESADERGEEILGALYDYAESIAPPPG